jgi:hypothetical protein
MEDHSLAPSKGPLAAAGLFQAGRALRQDLKIQKSD